MNADIMRRLSVVRQMYISGIDDAQRPSPLNALAILPFHDAAEMFLQIAAEYKQINMPKKADFDHYWTAFGGVGIELNSRESMRRLNSARVTLKHSGIMPDRAEIAGFSEMITNFLSDNTQTIFDVDFKSLSRAFLIGDPVLREMIEAGEANLQRGDYEKAMEFLKIAFDKAISFRGNDTLYDPRQRVSSINFFNNRENKGTAKSLKELSDVFGEAIMVVGYQLDFDGYRLLKTHSPVIHYFFGGNHQVQWTHDAPKDAAIVERCADFVVDTCLRLHEQSPFKR